MSNKCPSGLIERIGYSYVKKSSKKSVKVKPVCIEDKGPKLIINNYYTRRWSNFKKYGYTLKDSHENRIKVLKKAFKEN